MLLNKYTENSTMRIKVALVLCVMSCVLCSVYFFGAIAWLVWLTFSSGLLLIVLGFVTVQKKEVVEGSKIGTFNNTK